jgi:hypothetical protein
MFWPLRRSTQVPSKSELCCAPQIQAMAMSKTAPSTNLKWNPRHIQARALRVALQWEFKDCKSALAVTRLAGKKMFDKSMPIRTIMPNLHQRLQKVLEAGRRPPGSSPARKEWSAVGTGCVTHQRIVECRNH